MRKLLYTITLLFTLVSMDALAQAPKYKPRFMVGPTGGVNISNMIFNPKIGRAHV